MIYHIAGLPRSGTAWIAATLNIAPDVICVHEPVDDGVHSPTQGFKHYGQAGSHLLLPHYAEMENDLAVYIDRDPAGSYDSSNKVMEGLSVEDFDKYVLEPALEYKFFADKVIPYEELFTLKAVKDLWGSITNEDFEEDKVALMLNMNVQRHNLEYSISESYLEQYMEFINQRGEE